MRMMQASTFEYRHRYLAHGLIYVLGFAAPWHLPVWGFLRNASVLFLAANNFAKPSYQNFALYWNILIAVAALFAIMGAWLRVWGASYLGATTVHRGDMEGDRIIADGPYRYMRNPLYLGTILNTLAIAMLMRPDGAIVTILLIVLVQFRLIAHEEPYLLQQLGPAYERYLQAVPRLLPSLRPHVAGSGASPAWKEGVLSEIYVLGSAIAFATVGWSSGYSWEGNILHIVQGVLIALGLSVAARAFIPKSQF